MKADDIINTLDPDMIRCHLCDGWNKRRHMMRCLINWEDSVLCINCYNKQDGSVITFKDNES